MSEKEFYNWIKEIMEILMEMGEDAYLEYKLIMLAISKRPGILKLMEDIFALADKKRPLLLEMKGGVS